MRIMNDNGVVHGTKVVDDEGNDLATKLGITAITIDMPPSDIVTANVKVGLWKLDVTVGKVEWQMNDPTGDIGSAYVSSITFKDGRTVHLNEDGSTNVVTEDLFGREVVDYLEGRLTDGRYVTGFIEANWPKIKAKLLRG